MDVALLWHVWIGRRYPLHPGYLELHQGSQLSQGSDTLGYEVEHDRIYVPVHRVMVCLWHWRTAGKFAQR